MAGAVRTSAVGGSSTGTADRTATITPASGDLLVVFACVAANANDTPTCSDNNGGGTYDRIDVMNFAIAAVNYRLSVFIRTALMVNTTSTVVTVATGSNSSGAVHVLALTGLTKLGTNAVRSKGKQDNQAAATPTPVLNQNALTTNPVLVACGSADTTTSPPTNWTEIQDTNFANDTIALETAFRATGFTAASIAFAAAQSTQFCSFAMELDITAVSASPSVSPSESPSVSPSASVSPSSSTSPSVSPSASTSPSSSVSPSASASLSVSPSGSVSPSSSTSPSVSPSASTSPSPSVSPSSSASLSVSPSGSVSPSSSVSPSVSPSHSDSPSAPPPPATIVPIAFWNMRLVDQDVIDPYGAFNLTSDNAVDMDIENGKIGHAVRLDPVEGDILTGANGLSLLTADFTIWFWIRRSDAGTNFAQLLHIVNDDGQEFSILWDDADDLRIAGEDNFFEAIAPVVSDGEWHLVIIHCNNGDDAFVTAFVDFIEVAADVQISPPGASGVNTRWTWGNTDTADSDYDGGPIDIDAVGFINYPLDGDEREELWNNGYGREYPEAVLLTRQLLLEDSTTNVSDDMGGDPPVSYELQSTIDTNADSTVTTTISNSTTGAAGGETPQQQVVTESTGGDEVGRTTLAPGEEISAKVEVTGGDVDMELKRTDE